MGYLLALDCGDAAWRVPQGVHPDVLSAVRKCVLSSALFRRVKVPLALK